MTFNFGKSLKEILLEKAVEFGAVMLVGILLTVLWSLVASLAIWPLWNCVMTDVLGLPAISYWQAFGISLLTTLLFKGTVNVSTKK